MTLARTIVLLACVLAVAAPMAAHAHDARPVYVDIVEQQAGVYRAAMRVPPLADDANTPRLAWPDGCDVRETAARMVRGEPTVTSLVACDAPLAGRTLRIDYPLFNPALTTLVRLETSAGGMHTSVLAPDESVWSAPVDPNWRTVARDYAVLGFEHIWDGPDHLLFVAGLMLLARTPRRMLFAVTGFTLAHSVTLSLATLDLVRVPIAPVEVMIALSIVLLAAEVARNQPASFSHRYPIALSSAFGLLHGLGFASALAEIGLPRGDLALGLAAFNLGVEAGQVAFILAALALVWLLSRALSHAKLWTHVRPGLVLAAVYGLGITSAFWFIQRTEGLVGG